MNVKARWPAVDRVVVLLAWALITCGVIGTTALAVAGLNLLGGLALLYACDFRDYNVAKGWRERLIFLPLEFGARFVFGLLGSLFIQPLLAVHTVSEWLLSKVVP